MDVAVKRTLLPFNNIYKTNCCVTLTLDFLLTTRNSVSFFSLFFHDLADVLNQSNLLLIWIPFQGSGQDEWKIWIRTTRTVFQRMWWLCFTLKTSFVHSLLSGSSRRRYLERRVKHLHSLTSLFTLPQLNLWQVNAFWSTCVFRECICRGRRW